MNQRSPKRQDMSAGLEAIVQLITLYQNAEPRLLGLIIIFGVVAIIAFFSIPSFLVANNQNYAMYSFIVFSLFAIFTTFIFLKLSEQLPKQKIVTSKWERLILKHPPSQKKIQNLELLLQVCHDEILKFICGSIDSQINVTNLRTKIFLPKYDTDDVGPGAGHGYVCTLVMLPQLRINMNGCPDERLTLRPGEGCSGKAFVLGETQKSFNLQEVKNMIVFPDNQVKVDLNIRWIISVPLSIFDLVKQESKPVGVLSLDCLRNSITDDEGDKIQDFLQNTIATKLEKEIKQWETIRLYVGTRSVER